MTGNALKITALFVSDTNLFAGTWGSSAFRSTNNGTTWDTASNGLTSNHVHAFTVSPNPVGGTNLFAGTYFSDGVYLSTDNGGAAGIPARYRINEHLMYGLLLYLTRISLLELIQEEFFILSI
ncbi:MAG: hypothetical protein U5J96_12420, partial [Ignavibacteriaceae bacterium]|nr:hypothetical protein [Ignavibacteriaceae bacterium]